MRRCILDRLAWLLMLLVFLAGLTACQAAGGSFCAISKPIRLTGQSVGALTDQEVAAVLAQNEKGQRLCGWKP